MMPKIVIPPHAHPVIGHLDWNLASIYKRKLDGLYSNGIASFPQGIIVFTSVANIDADGVGGSKAVDPYWSPDTSLRGPDGSSCNSREFPGVVVPPYLFDLGVKLGDFGYLAWNNAIVPAQVYDVGPKTKIGEISIYSGRALGIIKPNQTDKFAATKGNDVVDLVTVIFPGSGPGHAIAPDLIASASAQLRTQLIT